MAVFLYYIPGKAVLKLKDIESAGIKGIFTEDTPRIDARVIANGPDGGTGMICAMDVPGRPQIGCYLDRQTWQKVGGYWIGYDKENPPKPEPLARPDGLDGHPVKLRINKYVVPVLRYFDPTNGSPIPRVFGFDMAGEPVEITDPKYIELCKEADTRYYWWCIENGLDEVLEGMEEPDRPSDKERFCFAARVLSVNYKVTGKELRVLGEIGTDELKKIEEAVFDWPSVVRFAKIESKKKPEGVGASTHSGEGSDSMKGDS